MIAEIGLFALVLASVQSAVPLIGALWLTDRRLRVGAPKPARVRVALQLAE
jgi:hypothetical protein